MLSRIAVSLFAVAVLMMAFACDEKPAAAPAASKDVLPANLVAATAPQGAKGVAETRLSAKDGDEVVIAGVVAGRVDPIAENRAVFTLLDGKIKTCDAMPGDTCKTPWDACCEPANVLADSSATVQVVDAAGKPLKVGLKGLGGLAPLKRVVVVGTYKTVDGKAVMVNAQSLYVEN